MLPLFSLRRIQARWAIHAFAIAAAGFVGPSAQAFPVEKSAPAQASFVQDADEATRERAALGVTLGRGSMNGVEIAGVMPNSPAAEAGLRPGDVMLAIDDQTVRTSSDVINLIAAHQPDDRVRLQVDRKGLRGVLRATLAGQSDVARRAALGVTLSKSAHGGVRVLQVVSASPADKAGLKIGDRILAIDDQAVTSYSDAIRVIGESDPGSDMKIEVDRYGLVGIVHASLTGFPQVFSVPRPAARLPAAPPPPVFELTPAEIDDQRGYSS